VELNPGGSQHALELLLFEKKFSRFPAAGQERKDYSPQSAQRKYVLKNQK
jgi:hypothetical protein